MAKGDNCPIDSSDDFDKGYNDGYEEQKKHAADISPPRWMSGDEASGYIAGARQARKDHQIGFDSHVQTGCAMGFQIILAFTVLGNVSLHVTFIFAIFLTFLGGLLEMILKKRKRRCSLKGRNYFGCIVSACGVLAGIIGILGLLGLFMANVFPMIPFWPSNVHVFQVMAVTPIPVWLVSVLTVAFCL